MNKFRRRLVRILIIIAILWIIITLWAEQEGPAHITEMGKNESYSSVLVVGI